MWPHAEFVTLGRWWLALSCSKNSWLEYRYRVLVTVLEVDWKEVKASLMLNSACWNWKVVCPTTIYILIIVTFWSSVTLATVRPFKCVESGPLRLGLFELLFESLTHTVTNFFCFFRVVLYDRVDSLNGSLCTFLFPWGNPACLSRLSCSNICVMEYSILDALSMLQGWKLYHLNWFFAKERHWLRHSYQVLLLIVLRSS